MTFRPSRANMFTGLVMPQVETFPHAQLPAEMQGTGGVKYDVQTNIAYLSDKIPQKWHKYIAMHEVCCVSNAGNGTHCLSASLYELSQVPDADKKEYLEFRIPFLENIKKYLDNNSSETTHEGTRNKEFARQIWLSIVYLRTVLLSEIKKSNRRPIALTHLSGVPIGDIKFPGTNP